MTATGTLAGPRRALLWAEAAALFVGAPLLMTAFFGQYSLFAVVWLLAGVALALLAITPGFRWRDLLRGPVLGEWRLMLGFTAASALGCAATVFLLAPESWLALPRERTGLWLMILLLYPPLSALPQEVIYRSLFFERYGALFSSDRARVAANGALFGLGHLFFLNPVTILITAVGGAAIGWAYLRGRSLALAWALHTAGGLLLFTLGLGQFFYHGAVGR